MAKINLKNLDMQLLAKYWYIVVLLIIVATGFYFRALPARFGELQALDPFYLYRMSEAVVEGNTQLLEADTTRYYPNSINFWETEFVLPVYLPAYSYMAISALGISMNFLDFAIIWPAIMGAIAVFVSFFLGKELFKSTHIRSILSGLFVAFFMATTPAFLTRSSAGFFEKEPISGPFIMLSLYFFIRAFRKGSWFDGAIAGVMLSAVGLSWGGASYLYLLFGGFLMFLFLANFVVVSIDYLFGGMTHILQKMEPFFSMQMIKAYVPMLAVSIIIPSLFPRNIVSSSYLWISSAAMIILAIRYSVDRFNLVRKEHIQFVLPSVLACVFVFMLVGSMFSDTIWSQVNSVTALVTGGGGAVVTTTVAENAPGSWDNVYSMLGNSFSNNIIPELSAYNQYFALYMFMFLGVGLLAYRFYKTHNWMMILPAFWGISTIWGIFYRVRLAFLLGPPAAVLGGFFCAWVIERSFRFVQKDHMRAITKHSLAIMFSVFAGFALLVLYRSSFGFAAFLLLSVLAVAGIAFYTKKNTGVNTKSLLPLVAVAFTAFMISINIANTLVYASSIGPSICFARDNTKCLNIDESGEIQLNLDQPWYQAFNFLATQTPEDSVVLSWWDFGYWFQERGERNSVVDGGHLGGAGLTGEARDYEVATWFTDNVENWNKHEWLEEYSVDYILMDYTLPGKYGAISKIASKGESIIGFLEFQRSGMNPRDNVTVHTFVAGPYELWVPLTDGGALVGGSPPMLLVKQGDQYVSKAYINDVCTTSGIIRVGEQEPSMGGCVTLGQTGIFYIPEEAEYSIFVDLQFMDGYGLPVEKVFDNQLVRIYKVSYDSQPLQEVQELLSGDFQLE